jgi:hypothetical protein
VRQGNVDADEYAHGRDALREVRHVGIVDDLDLQARPPNAERDRRKIAAEQVAGRDRRRNVRLAVIDGKRENWLLDA